MDNRTRREIYIKDHFGALDIWSTTTEECESLVVGPL